MRVDLERLLWRHRNGACLETSLVRALNAAVDRLVDERSGLEPHLPDLRAFAGGSVGDFDDGADRAVRLLGERRFDEALAAVRGAERALEDLQRVRAAHGQIEEARSELAQIVERLGLQPFGELTTLRILAGLLERARLFLDGGEPRKACFVVQLLRHLIAELGSRETSAVASSQHLLSWLEDLPRGQSVAPAAMAALRRLVEGGFLALAGGLADDLEIDLAVGARRAVGAGRTSGPLAELERTRRAADALAAQLERWTASAVPASSSASTSSPTPGGPRR